MKVFFKSLLVCFFVFISKNVLFTQEMTSVLDGRLMFERPVAVTFWDEAPKFIDGKEYDDYWSGKIRLTYRIYDLAALYDEPPTLLSRPVYDLAYNKGKLSRDDLLELFVQKQEYVIFDCLPRADVRTAQKRLALNDDVVGETHFSASVHNFTATCNSTYTISLIIDNLIVNIFLSYHSDDDFFESNMSSTYFAQKNGSFFWKDNLSIITFYNDLSSENYRKLPLGYQRIREAYDLVLSTIQVKNERGEYSNIQIVTPSFEFQKTHITTDNLRMRERRSVNSPIIEMLPRGTEVQELQTHQQYSTIDDMTAPWIKVTTKDGIVGWCFSGYLQDTRE